MNFVSSSTSAGTMSNIQAAEVQMFVNDYEEFRCAAATLSHRITLSPAR